MKIRKRIRKIQLKNSSLQNLTGTGTRKVKNGNDNGQGREKSGIVTVTVTETLQNKETREEKNIFIHYSQVNMVNFG